MFCLLDQILWHILRVPPQAALYRERSTRRKKAIQRRVRVQSIDESSNGKVFEEAARTARARALRRRSVRLVGGSVGTFLKM